MLCDELLMLGEISHANSAWQVEHCSRWRWGARCFGEQAANPAIHQKQPSLSFSKFFFQNCFFHIFSEVEQTNFIFQIFPSDKTASLKNRTEKHRKTHPKRKTHPQVEPPDRAEIGRAAWRYLHALAAQFPERPKNAETVQAQAWSPWSRLSVCVERVEVGMVLRQ